jgi:NAD(P)-dependent dehydrogenase (short-subunit alcohol dehydrogenase family)
VADQDLTGQVALVTGASTGIGRHLATGLAARGAAVAGMARGAERLAAAMAEVAEVTGARTLAVPADVTDRAAVGAAVARAVEEFGRIDLLVNNAGLIDPVEVPIWEADPDEWWRVVDSHVHGAHVLVSAVVPDMVRRGSGRVVNLGSGMGVRAHVDYSAYSVGKTGLMRITEALAAAGAEHGVRAFDIAPGVIETDMTHSMAMWDGFTDWTPPERVVAMVGAVAAGELDAWTGRLLSAMADDLDTMRATTPEGVGRQLRLRPYTEGDAFANR